MFGFSTIKIAIAAAIIAGLFGTGFYAGKAFEHPRAEAAGKTAGIAERDAYFAGTLKEQADQARALFDAAKLHNDQLKDDYAKLQTQWKIDHDANEQASAVLNKRIAALARDNGRLRDPHATATACRDSGDRPATAGAPDPAGSAGVQAAAGELLSGPLSDLLRSIVTEADGVVDVANACAAAIQVK